MSVGDAVVVVAVLLYDVCLWAGIAYLIERNNWSYWLIVLGLLLHTNIRKAEK